MTALDKRAAALIRGMTEDDEAQHVDYETLAAFVDGTCSRDERRIVLRHIEACVSCKADEADLRQTAATITPHRRAPWLWAAAAAIIVGVTALLVLRNVSKPAAPSLGIHDAASTLALDPRDAAAARAALDRGVLEVSPAALSLREPRGTLMGSAPATFDIVGPVATYVRETRPHFVWKPLTGTRQYRVAIFDGTHHPVLESPPLATTEWTADRDLDRGHEYIWQVEAGDDIVAPAPPLPPASFGVLGADAVMRIDGVAQHYPGSHLMLAIAEAREGAVDDARVELAQLQKLNPQSAAVARLVRALNHQ
jgi:hypothetical protein